MRIFTRYILGEVTSHALIGTGIFTFIIFTRELGQALELVVRNSAPLPSALELFALIIPEALTITLPAGVLIGILIGLSRLAADSEITAMKASGMGIWSFLRILSIFFLAAWLLALGNSVYLAPRSQAALARLEDKLKGSQVSFEIQPRVFYEGFPKYVLYVQDVKSAQGAAPWKGVFLADLTDATNPKITLAKEGIVVSEAPDRLHLHRSEEHTSELQSPMYLVCRLLLEKKTNKANRELSGHKHRDAMEACEQISEVFDSPQKKLTKTRDLASTLPEEQQCDDGSWLLVRH